MGLFSKIKKGLLKTKKQMISKIAALLHSFTKIDEDLFEQLEETLIMSDVGVETSLKICDELRKKIKEQGIKDPNEIMRLIHEIVAEMMGEDTGLDLSTSPSVIMVIGVNGAGKTTTIGKLCHKLKSEGKKVIVAAADTFRAAAIDQLQVWTDRAGVDIVKHAEGSDAASVVYDAITAAKARNCDVVVVDTAGRLHNKKNLMDELAKINRIVSQQAENCSREILLVLDATTGQNAVNQARLFKEAADITGIVLTKLDGTAKGGIVISIKNELDIPVKLIGLGEKIDDLQEFNSVDFVNALFGDDMLDEDFEIIDSDDEENEEISEDAAEETEEISENGIEETENISENAADISEEVTASPSSENIADENSEDSSEEMLVSVSEDSDEEAETEKPKERSGFFSKAKEVLFRPVFSSHTDEKDKDTEETADESISEETNDVSETSEQKDDNASVSADHVSYEQAESEALAENAEIISEEISGTEQSEETDVSENAEDISDIPSEETSADDTGADAEEETEDDGKKKRSFFGIFKKKKKKDKE